MRRSVQRRYIEMNYPILHDRMRGVAAAFGKRVLYGGKTPSRTLWHALYFPERRKVRVSFYLGEAPDADDTKEPRIRRSEYLEFVLAAPTEGQQARSGRDVR